jgi:hypothetical protein
VSEHSEDDDDDDDIDDNNLEDNEDKHSESKDQKTESNSENQIQYVVYYFQKNLVDSKEYCLDCKTYNEPVMFEITHDLGNVLGEVKHITTPYYSEGDGDNNGSRTKLAPRIVPRVLRSRSTRGFCSIYPSRSLSTRLEQTTVYTMALTSASMIIRTNSSIIISISFSNIRQVSWASGENTLQNAMGNVMSTSTSCEYLDSQPTVPLKICQAR